jgi:hypothetical protein
VTTVAEITRAIVSAANRFAPFVRKSRKLATKQARLNDNNYCTINYLEVPRSLKRTGLRRMFPGNREKYRENHEPWPVTTPETLKSADGLRVLTRFP